MKNDITVKSGQIHIEHIKQFKSRILIVKCKNIFETYKG